MPDDTVPDNKEEPNNNSETVDPKLAGKKAKAAVKTVVEAGVDPKKAVNIIGDIEKPENLENKEDVQAYLKKLDEKMDLLLAGNKKEVPITEAPPVNDKKEVLPWWERPLM